MYTIQTLRNKAKRIGYRVEKGVQHYTVSGAVFTNVYGERYPGYMVQDLATGIYEWGSYNEYYTHLWMLEDVEDFLKSKYEELGLEF